MPKVYRIRDWKKHFEVSQSMRIVGPLSWVGMPTKHDGKSFRRLIRQPNGPAHFCCWCLIVQIAAKCPTRGVLADADGPLSANDLSDKTGCPADLFSESLQLLSSKDVGWIEKVDMSNLLVVSENGRAHSEHAPSTEQNRTEQNQPVGRLVGGDLKKKQINFKCLPKVQTVHLSSVAALSGIHRLASSEHPSEVTPDEGGLLNIIGAAERALRNGGIKWFVGIVRKRCWENIDGDERAAAKKKLKEHRAWIAQETKAGREVPEDAIPLPDKTA
jgi:hypothetical protein